jgi:serine/threonine protein kinase
VQPLAPATVIAERYRLERKLGAGGMGSVWLATDLSLDSTCAIKLVDPDKVGTEEVRVRFQREARAAAQIRSANVVDVFDHGLWNDMPFIVMEHLQGEDLGARLDRQGRLDLRQTYEIVAQVARALVRAHAMGIVHRDLKPENILMDRYRRWRITDFGIAKGEEEPGGATGTPAFAAPEQLLGETQGPAVDLFAAAGIVAFALTGEPPFAGRDANAILAQQLADQFDASRFEEPVGHWLKRGLASDPLQRFPDGAEMREAWQDVVAQMERRSHRPERWWTRFSGLGQGPRG